MGPSDRSPVSPAPDGVTVAVRVTPRAPRTRIAGIAADADGAPYLAVAVTAAPERGKANGAVVRLLSKQWRIARTAFTVTSGVAARRKTLHITGDPGRLLLDLRARLADIAWKDRHTDSGEQ